MTVSATMPSRGARPAHAGPALLSVVVPVYNESLVIAAFHERATRALSAIPNCSYELIFVDDGSRDDSYEQLAVLAETDPRIRVVKFSRNFGHQIAISAGVDHACGDCVVVIDADLQDPPEVIVQMVEQWRAGFDVVYGVRASRAAESAMKLFTASLFYRLLNSLTRIPIPVDVGDFRLISRRVANQLRQLREKDRFVRGLVSWLGYRQTGVSYHREARFAGETKYPYSKMIKFAVDGVTSFSTVPLKLASWLGYGASALAFIYLVDVFLQKYRGITVQGWATTMVAMLFLGGVQLVCLGIIGEYLGRVFTECKPRPMYVVDELLGVPLEVPPPSEAGGRPLMAARASWWENGPSLPST
jgi:dolichol-phosphate mannosyltransferase